MDDFDATTYGLSIADDYDRIYEDYWDTDSAVAKLAELAQGGPVLELGIGTGRLALPLAERGLVVHGIDSSAEMAAQLAAKPGGDQIPVVIGNFDDATAGGGRDFALVVLAVNTIFALPDQASQVRCFENAARHLRPGGRFVVEAWVPDVGAFRRNRLVRPRIHRDDEISVEVAELDPIRQTMRTTQAVFRSGAVRVFPANHRYAWPAELDLMARIAGLRLASRWADWNDTPCAADSTDHVSVYEKP